MLQLISTLGLAPVHPYSLWFPVVALALWLVFLPFAHLHKIKIFYNSSLRASFYEEIVYRGFVYGAVMCIWHNQIYALIISSLLFGVAHMQNLWWAGWRRSWKTTVYAGFTAGPVFGLIRLFYGDIYLGILIHFLHNLYVILPPPGHSHKVARTPRDYEL